MNNKEYKRPTRKVVCNFCSKEFLKETRAIKRSKTGNHYCSRSCATKRKLEVRYGKKDGIKYIISNAKKRADKKGIEFNLTKEILNQMLKDQKYKCALSGVKIYVPERDNGVFSLSQASLDRIDNEKGYVEDNVQFVALGINYMRNRASENEALKFIKEIKSIE